MIGGQSRRPGDKCSGENNAGASPASVGPDDTCPVESVLTCVTHAPATESRLEQVRSPGAASRRSSGHSGVAIIGRELDVLRLPAAGDSNTEIARQLTITVHTIERHVSNMYRKIGARGRTDATAYAPRHCLTCVV